MAKTILSIKQTVRGFGISTMALSHWRRGSVNRKPLPAIEKARGESGKSVGFDLEVLKKWAAKHDVAFDEKKAMTEPKDAKRGPVKKAATAIKQVTRKPTAAKKAAPTKPAAAPVKPKPTAVKAPAKPNKDAIKPVPSSPSATAAAAAP